MKNFYKSIIAISMLTSTVAANAGWNTDLSQNLLISEKDMPNQNYTLCAATPQGDVWVAWLSWEDMNACLKVQLLDKDGNTLFSEGGIYVSKQPTPTWSSGYDIKSTADGDAVIVYCDKRNGNWQAYLYRIGKDGEMKWGDTGMAVVDEASKESCLDPKLCVTNAGNILVGFDSMLTGANMTKVYKYTPEGKPAWGGYISIPQTNAAYTFNITATGDDAAFVSYFTAGGEYELMKYTANGEAAWEEAVKIDDSGVVAVTVEPSVASDFNDGLLVGWTNKNSSFSSIGLTQHFDRDGKKLWSKDYETVTMPNVAATPAGDCYIAYRFGPETMQNLTVSRIDSNGNEAWMTDVLGDDSYLVSVYGMVPCAEGMMVVYRNAFAYNDAVIEYSTVAYNGEPVTIQDTVSDAPGDKGHGDIAVTGTDVVVVWEDNGASKGAGCIYAQNIDFTPASIDAAVADGREITVSYADGLLTCTSGKPFAAGRLAIIAVDGTTIASADIASGATVATVEVPALGPGVYVATVTDGNRTDTRKIAVR